MLRYKSVKRARKKTNTEDTEYAEGHREERKEYVWQKEKQKSKAL